MDLDEHLDAIVAGDAEAFAAWLAGAEAALRHRLRSFAQRVDTEAVLQEALLRVWQVAPRVERSGPNSLLRFATRVTVNMAIDETRRRQPDFVAEAPEEPVDPVEPDPLLRRAVLECRGEMPRTPAKVFQARVDARGVRSDQELADTLGMTLNTFLKSVGRARRFLVECLRRKGVEVAL